MTSIAQLLGPERCVDELIPMLTELIDKIDVSPELMMHLAEQLGKLTDFLGEPSNCESLLKPLEMILSHDDTTVREKAVQSMKRVGDKISQQTITATYLPLID